MKKWIAGSMAVLMLMAGGCGTAQKPQDANAGRNDVVPVNFTDDAITGEITVSAYDALTYGRRLNAAAKAFEAKYPGTKINVETFSTMPEIKTSSSEDGSMSVAVMVSENDPEAEQNYLRALNTEMMGGGGADVLAMDVLPYHKYADAGQLLDLQTLMNADETFREDDYYMNVVNAMKYNGGQYVMPIDFSFMYLTYDTTLLNDAQKAAIEAKRGFTYDELITIGEMAFDANEKLAMFEDNKTELFAKLFGMNLVDYLDLANKTCDFTSGAFEALLEKVAQYEADGYLMPMPDWSAMETGGFMEAMEAMRQGGGTEVYFSTEMSYGLLNHFNTSEDGAQIFFSTGTGGTSKDNHEIAGLLLMDSNGQAEVQFQEAYGINANTENPRLAWEFVKFMLSEEMQLSMSMMGMPVNKAASEEAIKQQLTQGFMGGGGVAVAAAMARPEDGAMRPEDRVVTGEDGDGNMPLIIDGDAVVNVEGLEGNVIEWNALENGELELNIMPPDDAAAEILEPNMSIGMMPITSFEDFVEPPFVKAVLNAEQTEIFERYMSQLNAFLADLRSHTVTDMSVMAVVEEELMRFFGGEATASETAKALQSKLGLILGEQ